jgi:hypothetical protein
VILTHDQHGEKQVPKFIPISVLFSPLHSLCFWSAVLTIFWNSHVNNWVGHQSQSYIPLPTGIGHAHLKMATNEYLATVFFMSYTYPAPPQIRTSILSPMALVGNGQFATFLDQEKICVNLWLYTKPIIRG